MTANKITLTPQLIENFQKAYLRDTFDSPSEAAPFHKQMWRDALSDTPWVAWAAPRGFAKSTAITLTYALVCILFRQFNYILLVSDSETQAVQFLRVIRFALEGNEDLQRDFELGVPPDMRELTGVNPARALEKLQGTDPFLRANDTEVEVAFQDGHVVRIIAKGSEQRIRGLTWRTKRPDLILCDDLEYDEIVNNAERRRKFKDWFFRQLMPAGSKGSKVRMVGTILHSDSLLNNLMENRSWLTRKWAAHASFDDFSDLLWESRWDEPALRTLQKNFIDAGEQDSYSQEMLNEPLAASHALFRADELLAIPPSRSQRYLLRKAGEEQGADSRTESWGVSVDLAVSKKTSADRTVMTVWCLTNTGHVDIVDVIAGRMSPDQTIEEFFKIEKQYGHPDSPLQWQVEEGVIQKSILPFLNTEMRKRGVFLNLKFIHPNADKVTRSASIRGRIRAAQVRFEQSALWWSWAKLELLTFPRGKHDDFVDTLSQIGMVLDRHNQPLTEEEVKEEDWAEEMQDAANDGRNAITGY